MQIAKRKMHSGGPIAINEQAKRAQSFCTLQSTFCIAASNRRSGLSLLEVLISIGIVAIGLLSVAALLPVGGLLVQRAEVADRAANLGQNAFLEFKTRGLGDPDKALRWGGSQWVGGGGTLPVAIDPLMCARAQAASPPAQNTIQWFPIDSGISGAPLMQRLTVTPACTVSGTNYIPSVPLADAIFSAADDVLVELPEDSRLPATSQYTLDGSSNPLKRESFGQYSWLVTLTPNMPNQQIVPGSELTASFVIFDRRSPLPPSATNITETMVTATVAGSGIGGGDVLLGSTSNPATPEQLALAQPGNWMMLCRYEPSGLPSPNPPTWKVFKWYRIVAVEGVDDTSTTQNVTLAGPDWPTNTGSWGTPPAGTTWDTYACLFDGVVAVYQRTLRIEGPGRW